jgi:multidrug efflux pump subunit AcrA (membrane-fusion protein)
MRGRVVEIVPSSDPASRTVVVRVHLSETKDVVPGMFGRLLLPMRPEQILTVPESALIRAGQLTMVNVVSEGRLQRRTVQLGRAIGNQYEVLSGIAAGETVAIGKAQ